MIAAYSRKAKRAVIRKQFESKSKSFVHGMARAMDIGAQLDDKHFENALESDERAIEADWAVVGNDMRHTIGECKHNDEAKLLGRLMDLNKLTGDIKAKHVDEIQRIKDQIRILDEEIKRLTDVRHHLRAAKHRDEIRPVGHKSSFEY